MKIIVVILSILLSFNSYAQKTGETSNELLVKPYAREANRLDLQTNTDSVDRAYLLHTKVLELDKKHVPSYRSKISIDYKRSNYNEALHTANSFVKNLPGYGDAWVYLGIVQSKLSDSAGARMSFKKAINIYEHDLTEIKDKSSQDQIKFKQAIVLNFLGVKEPVHANSSMDKNGNAKSSTTYINDIETVEKYVGKFMTNNGVQFF